MRKKFSIGTSLDLQWKRIMHDKIEEKAIDGWFQFDYLVDLANLGDGGE